MRCSVVAAVIGVLCLASASLAEVRLPRLFGDHMVLQRGAAVPIWGWADPGEAVTVTIGDQSQTATAGADKKWTVRFASLPEGAPVEVRVKGTNEIVLRDVLVGEVWLASGQSNMDFTVAKTQKRYFSGTKNEAAEIAAADYPKIRMFYADWKLSDEPLDDLGGKWEVCSPQTVGEFSAVGYFFARDVQKVIDKPMGVIVCAFGASTAQAWVSRDAMAADPKLSPMLDAYAQACADWASGAAKTKYEAALAEWTTASEKAKAEGKPAPRKPGAPKDPHKDQHNPNVLYNGMIAAVAPYGMRGALWYQGESNDAKLYPELMSALIRDWRARWGIGDFPFLFVQLPNHQAPTTQPSGGHRLAGKREAQAWALTMPNTGMAVTIDAGEEKDVHPRDKQTVGDRLARVALATVYDQPVEYAGPVYESMAVEGDKIRVRFSHVGGGLVAKDGGAVKGFAIAGADEKYVWADATIDGETVVLSSPDVKQPTLVRYAWGNNPPATLYNKAGLPAWPFRSDGPQYKPGGAIAQTAQN